jgi:transposase, IS30 family
MAGSSESRPPDPTRPPTVRRARFLELLAAGMRTLEASREVGVSYRTASDWAKGVISSNGRRWTTDGVLIWAPKPREKPPREEKVISARFLSVEERIEIADLHHQGVPVRQIALRLARSPSTISRELRRNAHPGSGDYRPWAAQRRAARRRTRPKPRKITLNPQLREEISDGLRRKWSPEQISRRLRRKFPGRPEMHVTHETIYQALYVQGRGELRRELARCLRTGRAVRKPQRRPDERRQRFQAPMLMISERPAEVADRAVPGHWEGDLILGARHQSAIATLVERSTRYVMLAHLPHGFAAEQVKEALVMTISSLPAQLRRTLTWDQGTEMGAHHLITMATDMPIYFCDPGSPWQRGSNENTNGLLRQYFPKGTDFRKLIASDLDTAAAELNGRPRKTLDWDTPAERLAALLQP